MKYTYLGRTGVTVSRLCLGCMSYGDPGLASVGARRIRFAPVLPPRRRGGHQLLRHRRHVLAGRERGSHRPGAARVCPAAKSASSPPRCSTPWAIGPNMGGLSRKHIVQGCEASLRRLGMDTIDLYQIHRFDPHTPIDEMLAALDYARPPGQGALPRRKLRWRPGSSPKRCALSERHGWARFVTMQNHYNLLYREEEREMIPLCEAEGVAVIPWSPLARGLLAGTRRSPSDSESTKRARERRLRAQTLRSAGRSGR